MQLVSSRFDEYITHFILKEIDKKRFLARLKRSTYIFWHLHCYLLHNDMYTFYQKLTISKVVSIHSTIRIQVRLALKIIWDVPKWIASENRCLMTSQGILDKYRELQEKMNTVHGDYEELFRL